MDVVAFAWCAQPEHIRVKRLARCGQLVSFSHRLDLQVVMAWAADTAPGSHLNVRTQLLFLKMIENKNQIVFELLY